MAIDTLNYKLEKILNTFHNDSKAEINKPSKSIPGLFWCKNYKRNENCCYNHFIGLPQKDGRAHPLYPYEQKLVEDLKNHEFVAILKATGLGLTEFCLRYAEHKCLTEYENAQVVILVGPNRDLAKVQIFRISKHLFGKIKFEGTDYEIRLGKGNVIHAFPSMNIDAARSLENPKLILIDEAAFFGMVSDEEVRAIAERYQAKSQAQVIMYSTPGSPDGMFYGIMKEEPSQYHKVYLDYTCGLPKTSGHPGISIYTEEAIAKAKQSPAFEREYNLQWGFGQGNIFDQNALTEISKEHYDLTPISTRSILAIDPGYGSSKFAIIGAEQRDGIVYILHAEEYEHASYTEMIDRTNSLIKTYNYTEQICDDTQPGMIRELPNCRGFSFKEDGLKATDRAAMEVSEKNIRINPQFEELIRQLRAVQRNEKGTADKKRLSFDLGDAFLMAVWKLAGSTFYAALSHSRYG